MTDFNWSAYERWATRKEHENEPHIEECNCTHCHQHHIDKGIVNENAQRPDYQCCANQMESWLIQQRWEQGKN